MIGAVRTALDDRASIITALQGSGTEISDVDCVIAIASDWHERLASETEAPATIGELIPGVQLTDKGLRIALKVPMQPRGEQQGSSPTLRLSHFVPTKVKRRGVEMRIIVDGRFQAPPAGRPGVAQGNRARAMLVRGGGLRPYPIAAGDCAARRASQPLRHACRKTGVCIADDRRDNRRWSRAGRHQFANADGRAR